jgi:hypothetical protein
MVIRYYAIQKLDINQMENYNDEEDFLTEENEESQESGQKDRKWIRDLEKRAKSAESAKAEAEAAKKELSFMKAGINLDSPQGKLFAKAYDGEYSVEAVKAAAEEYGVIEASKPQIPNEELESLDRISRAGSIPSSVGLDDPFAKINQADSPQEIIEILKSQGVIIDSEQPGQWKSLV